MSEARNTFGYGRYKDDPEWIGCPRARTSETPCIARDGQTALADDQTCVGCGKRPGALLKELAPAAPELRYPSGWAQQADKLHEIVRELTS